MCMELLRMLGSAKLPFTVADRALIDRLRMLDAAGLIKAFVPPVHVDCDDCVRQDPAMVIEITPRGHKTLSQDIGQAIEAITMRRPAQAPLLEAPPRGAHPAWWHGGRRLRSRA